MGADDASPPPDAYGQPISAERQAELQAILDAWNVPSADHGDRRGPFDRERVSDEERARLRLSGADVGWLVNRLGRDQKESGPNLHLEGADLQTAHLERAGLQQAHLEGADMLGARLEYANLQRAHLEGAILGAAHLEGASLDAARLEGADLRGAHLVGAHLRGAYLDGAYLREAYLEQAHLRAARLVRADLRAAHLEGADLDSARLEGADLSITHLEGTVLFEAHLEGAHLFAAHLEGKTYRADDPDFRRISEVAVRVRANLPPADLRAVVLDDSTVLTGITLGKAVHGMISVADVHWGGANLGVVDWTPILPPAAQLGDERAAWEWKPKPFVHPRGKPAGAQLRAARNKHAQAQAYEKLEAFRAAVRANRQLATALRDQGMNEEADQFAYRAQVLQRQVFWLQRKRVRALLSLGLDLVAGHGYRPGRSITTYLAVLAAFTGFFLLASVGAISFGLPPTTYHELPWYEALVLSVASFHGRGFFQPVQSPGDPIAILAAIEAIFGLFIEVSFIATFTQRFFGKQGESAPPAPIPAGRGAWAARAAVVYARVLLRGRFTLQLLQQRAQIPDRLSEARGLPGGRGQVA